MLLGNGFWRLGLGFWLGDGFLILCLICIHLSAKPDPLAEPERRSDTCVLMLAKTARGLESADTTPSLRRRSSAAYTPLLDAAA